MNKVRRTAVVLGAASALLAGMAGPAPAATAPADGGDGVGPAPGLSDDDSLREVAPDDLLIGTAAAGGGHHLDQDYQGLEPGQSPFLFDETYREHLAEEFSSLSPENQMKWEFIHPERDRYDFAEADAIAAFAEENGQKLRGHTLLWHSQNPAWLEEGDFTDSELREILRDHIQTLVGRYAGSVYQWDVANEIFDDQGQLRVGPTAEGGNIWITRLGPGIIADAFRWAREADPDAKLFFNDYGVESINPKSDAYYALVQDLMAEGVPVDGFSVQGHLSTRFGFPGDLQANLERFDALGLETAVTEVDVRMDVPEGEQPTAAQEEQQADYYRRTLEACLAVDGCTSYTIWGFTDRYSWVPVFFEGEGFANVMTEDYERKPAYYALQEALALAPVGQACPAGLVPESGFRDLSRVDAETRQAVDCLVGAGVARGANDVLFQPTRAATRAQVALFLRRLAGAAGVDLDASAPGFTDLRGLSVEGRNAVNALVNAGVIEPRSDSAYDPFGVVTRADLAGILAAFQAEVLGTPLSATEEDAFTDDEGTVAEDAINQLAAVGVLEGVDEGVFGPARAVTRGELALAIARHVQVALDAGLLQPLYAQANAGVVTTARSEGQTVSLTFDDGPNPSDTLRLLDVLRRNDVKATFCLWGDHVVEHPEVVRAIARDGHVLCNHTMHHDNLETWTPEQIRADLEETSAAIRAAVPGAHIPYFRAPFGVWGQSPQVAAELGMQPLGWELVIEDWVPPGADVLAERLREGITPGSVVLLHDGGGDRSQTVDAVETVIPELKAEGYRFDRPALVGPVEPPAAV